MIGFVVSPMLAVENRFLSCKKLRYSMELLGFCKAEYRSGFEIELKTFKDVLKSRCNRF